MTNFLRTLRLLALVFWVGGLLFFISAVTRVAFAVLPDTHTAGAVVRGTLNALHHTGFIAGAVYLVATVTLIATQRDSHIYRAVEVLLALGMLASTAYSQFSVIPRMESDRLALGGDVSSAAASTPARLHFDRLHRVSVRVEGGVLIAGLLLVCLASLHQRDNRID